MIFERDLAHQNKAISAILGALENAEFIPHKRLKNEANHRITHIDKNDIAHIQSINQITPKTSQNHIFDIAMETGTGKTYTYTKAAFALNRAYGLKKFIIIVPTLAIKSGTINFLNAKETREHFRVEFDKEIGLFIVEAVKNNKKQNEQFPQSVREFVNANDEGITFLVINAAMLNSKTMEKSYDSSLFDSIDCPLEALKSINPVVIIDEPHKFDKDKKSWDNISKIAPPLILRFGATFKEYENLLYKLTALEAFNENLIKGIKANVCEFSQKHEARVTLKNIENKEAIFILNENGKNAEIHLGQGEDLGKIHSAIGDIKILKISENKHNKIIELDNGEMWRCGNSKNPYAYDDSTSDIMLQNAIKRHFEIEKELLSQTPRIKPLSLFFINDIAAYREQDGTFRVKFENALKNAIENELKHLSNEPTFHFYKAYLQDSLRDINATHGGYFSKDNSDKDENIKQEIDEILRDKEKLLSLKNTRRFIFSKWTLKEGWDNPNIFVICKLRSSGSEISKLQEVGRGLRLPVNENGARVKDGEYFLHYFVDFNEGDFVEKLVSEINDNAGVLGEDIEKLDTNLIAKICQIYQIDDFDLMSELVSEKITDKKFNLLSGGLEKLKSKFPKCFSKGLKEKIKSDKECEKKARIRPQNYAKIKELWEAINQKVILEYKIQSEAEFEGHFRDFLCKNAKNFKEFGIKISQKELKATSDGVTVMEQGSLDSYLSRINTMSYREFLLALSKASLVNLLSLDSAFRSIKSVFDIRDFLNPQVIRHIAQAFNHYLIDNSINKLSVSYHKINAKIHPTKFTNENGEALESVIASDLGRESSHKESPKNYLFDEIYFDEDLECENIAREIKQVKVFAKIPRNSIKIPLIGGNSYSPDFAYIVSVGDNESLNLILECKNKDERDLFANEKAKIDYAREFFNALNEKNLRVSFQTQLDNENIEEILKNILKQQFAF